MNIPEIRMLQQSDAFVRRLVEATQSLGGSKYQLRRRVNWSHRYHTCFYQHEAKLFTSNVDDYVAGRFASPPTINDVFAQPLNGKALMKVLAKITAHWLFLLYGAMTSPSRRGLAIYRKAYVDDIELVFNPEQPSVLRAVYPFPLSMRRQIRYVADLSRRNISWVATGNRYVLRDVVLLLLRRDLRSLQRMESRAQIRNAYAVAAGGFKLVQLSDEFDLGSLDLSRALAHRGVAVVNSAHGAGKYLPVHAYGEFHVLTWRQRSYYIPTRYCRYIKRTLNEKAAVVAGGMVSKVLPDDSKISFVLIGGTTSYGVGEEYLARNESDASRRISDALADDSRIRLMYRPHPNLHNAAPPPGFRLLTELGAINGRAGTVFASYSSTCQIDPAFKGRKILIRGEFMYPETWFDDSEEIMNIDELIVELQRLAEFPRGVAEPKLSGPDYA